MRSLARTVGSLVFSLPLFMVSPGSLEAQDEAPEDVIAFGDSITRGDSSFDEERRGGYPGRLQGKLRRTNPDAIVRNFGVNGELTLSALARVGGVLTSAPNADTFVLMEGTNDVSLFVQGQLSFESIRSNLASIANRAATAGLDVHVATLIPRPPSASTDIRSIATFGVSREIRDLAFQQSRGLADFWEAFNYTPNNFNTIYTVNPEDRVGHPNAAGFALMADIVFDLITGVDSQGPVAGELSIGYEVDEVRPGTEIELTLYDLGEGMAAGEQVLTNSGRPLETTDTGNARKRTLVHQATAASLSCFGRLGHSSSDLADPPNVVDRLLVEFRVQGGGVRTGDIDKSCRVDGLDLLIVAFAFGSVEGEPRFSRMADLTDDGRVNGMDLAELARNFGVSND